MRIRSTQFLLATALFLALAAPAIAREPAGNPDREVVGVGAEQLDPQFWVGKLGAQADRVLLDGPAIDAANARMRQEDPTIHDVFGLPDEIPQAQVREWVEDMSSRPTRTLYDEQHEVVPAATLDGLVDALALDRIAPTTAPKYALVVQRAPLRTFPTSLRVFSNDEDTDIDRFQESALFPGTPVAIVHESRDGQWAFVVSPRYRAWIERKYIAVGERQVVEAFADSATGRLVTGAKVRTVYTPELPQASEVQLDMGTFLPAGDGVANNEVNGQHPYTGWQVQLPVRNDDGTLRIVDTLIQRNADTHAGPLPLTQANIIRQGFKFLGERYGWGHDYNARDCSGFVSEIYASMGVLLPRNTRDQSKSPSLHKTLFDENSTTEEREAAVKALQPGDLVYIPGHVMMVIGWIDDQPYVIHDTNGGTMRGPDGKLRKLHLNGVSVTPLLPLMMDEMHRYVDRMTSVVRVATPKD